LTGCDSAKTLKAGFVIDVAVVELQLAQNSILLNFRESCLLFE